MDFEETGIVEELAAHLAGQVLLLVVHHVHVSLQVRLGMELFGTALNGTV